MFTWFTDIRQFIEDHREEIFLGEEETLPAGEKAVLWSYPCSGENQGILEPEEELTFSEFYKDSQERIWGNLGYYRGIRDRWICLSDPENEEIPMEEEPPVIPDRRSKSRQGRKYGKYCHGRGFAGSKRKGKSSGMVFYPSGFCGCGDSRSLYLDLLDPEEDGLMECKNTGCTVIYFPL